MSGLERAVGAVIVVGALAVATGCQTAATDLEIVALGPAAGSVPALGGTVTLEAQVRNNGPDPATVAAAVAGTPEMGLLRRGPEREIRRNRTETLTVEVPVERTFLRGCEFVATVFLVRPGEPPSLRDLWDDPVPENHSRETRTPFERPSPTALEATEPVIEVVERMERADYLVHYEADVRVVPAESLWAIDHWSILIETAAGEGIERLSASVRSGRLRSGSLQIVPERRNAVARATIDALSTDCAGEERIVSAERLAVQLARQ